MAEYAQEHEDRDRAITAAYASGTYSMRQIGDFFGLHLSRISKIVGTAAKRGNRKELTTFPV